MYGGYRPPTCRRCPTCLTNWPLVKLDLKGEPETFIYCPEDGDDTSLNYSEPAISIDEARSRVLNARFVAYLAERDAERHESDVEQFSAQLMDWNGDPSA